MMRRLHYVLFFFLVFLISGCAHVVSKNLRERADTALTFRQVSQNPDGHKGKIVIWGGEIIETVNQKEGTTLIEIFQRPLGWREEPKKTAASEGRFLVLADHYLDPYLFRRGKKITVAGEILGEKIKPIGQMEYRYPLLAGKQIYVWEEYYDYPAPHYYYYGPWWGYSYWRGPPYWGRFRFHDHRH